MTLESTQGLVILSNKWNPIPIATSTHFNVQIVPEAGGRLIINSLNAAAPLFYRNHAVEGQLSIFDKNDGYTNAGGGVFWVAPQALWGWPPPPSMEGPWHVIEQKSNEVQLRSSQLFKGTKLSQKILVQNIQPINLENLLKLQNSNTTKTPNMSIWRVFQYIPGGILSVPIDVNNIYEAIDVYPNFTGYSLDELINDSIISIKDHTLLIDTARITQGEVKFGVKSSKAAYTYTLGDFRVSHQFNITIEPGMRFPHGNGTNPVELYFSPGKYFEGELLSPLTALEPNESVSVVETLEITKPPL